MANEFLSIKSIARLALPRLIENLVFPNLIYKDYSNDFVLGKGDTIQIRKPVILEAREFDESTGTTAQDVKEKSVDVTLDKLATVDAEFGSIARAVSVDDLNRLFIEPAAVALAEKINSDGLALYADVTGTVGTAGTTPSTLEAFALANKALDDKKVPTALRRGVWDPAAMAKFRQLGDLVNAEKSGTTEALRAGSIGNVFGIDNYMAQGVKVTEDTKGVKTTHNLVFHQNAFAFVTRPLAAPAGVESYTTSYNGITLRVVRGYDMQYKKEMISMDVLYGYKTIYPDMAVQVLG